MKNHPYDPASYPWRSRPEKFPGRGSAPSPTADRAPRQNLRSGHGPWPGRPAALCQAMAGYWSARSERTAPVLRSRWSRGVQPARSVRSAGRAGGRAQPPSARNYQATDVTKAPSRRPEPAARAFYGRNRRVEPPDPAEDETCAWSAWLASETHAVVGIHCTLAREIADLLA